MASTIVSPEKAIGRLSEWYRLMTEAGLKFEDLQTPIDDSEFRERLARFWRGGAPKKVSIRETRSQLQAKEILGRSYVSLAQATRFMKVNFDQDQRDDLAVIPFSSETLDRCRETHILFPGYPLDRDEIAKRFPTLHVGKGTESIKLRWYLISKREIPGTGDMTLKQVEEFLAERKASVPTANEIFYLCLLWWQITGDHLLSDSECSDGRVWVWCSAFKCSEASELRRSVSITNGMRQDGIRTKSSVETIHQDRLMAIESVDLP